MKKKLSCKVKNGKLPDIKNQVAEILRKLEGEWIDLIIEYGDKRTSPQNRMLYGFIYPQLVPGFREAWGVELDTQTIHNIMKENTMTCKEILSNEDKSLTYNRSTADLTKEEFSNYIKEIDLFSMDFFGYNLNMPEDIL